MEGLIKGLIDVALGGGEEGGAGRGDGGADHRQRRGGEEDGRDERSRSSWAEVVGSDERGGRDDQNHGQNQQHHHQQQQKQQHQSAGGSEGGWETVGEKHKKRPQKVPTDHWEGFKRPPSEQHYVADPNYGTSTDPSREELSDLSKACGKLWELDANRLAPGRDYEIDCGDGKKAYQKEDAAAGTLFRRLGEDVLRRPTFSRFCSLLDNYNPDQGSREVVTAQEKHEQEAFVEEISRTAPIKYLHKYLAAKGIVSESCEEFKRMLESLWFDLYGRGGTAGSSSAFEHVFVGEIKNSGEREISGFHNWIQFYLEEAKGRLDYQGYIFPRRRGEVPDSETQLLTVQFEWNGILKSLSSTLIGVSPEFEVALYTLCFYAGSQDNHVYLGPYSVNIKCYRQGNNRIGSAFPIAES